MPKIAVLGSHPATRDQAPFDDPTWQIWACSPHNAPPFATLKRIDRWYEVHLPAFDKATRDEAYMDYIRELSKTTPVYMRDRSGHPDALEYPMQEVVGTFGPYFIETSSIAFIMAEAIRYIIAHRDQENVLGIFGVMQQSASEFTYQKPGIQFFVTMAVMQGIDIAVPEQSQILVPRKMNF